VGIEGEALAGVGLRHFWYVDCLLNCCWRLGARYEA